MPYRVRRLNVAQEVGAHQIAAVVGAANSIERAVLESDWLELREKTLPNLASSGFATLRSTYQCKHRDHQHRDGYPAESLTQAATHSSFTRGADGLIQSPLGQDATRMCIVT